MCKSLLLKIEEKEDNVNSIYYHMQACIIYLFNLKNMLIQYFTLDVMHITDMVVVLIHNGVYTFIK